MSLGVILLVRQTLGVAEFTAWGWRIPFIISALLVGISIYIRLRMNESPLFAKLKTEGKVSTNPLKESFGHKANLKMVLVALFGATAGQGVVWYTGEFVQSNIIIAIALMIATPFFIVFGAWSDKVGRKWIMMAGMLLAIICYRPIYSAMYEQGNLKTKTEIVEQTKIDVKRELVPNAVADSLITTTTLKAFTDGTTYKEVKKETILADKTKEVPKPEIKKESKLPSGSMWFLVMLITIQVLFVTMVYGPIAAFLVELFPTRIRYSSMSLPYHIGNGVFGGLTPFIATRLYEASKSDTNPTGDPLSGLWYPIVIAGVCFVIGSLYLSNKIDENVAD